MPFQMAKFAWPDLSKAKANVSLMVYVIRLCHASVNMRALNRDSDLSLESMEIPPPSTSLANCYMAPGLAPAGLL